MGRRGQAGEVNPEVSIRCRRLLGRTDVYPGRARTDPPVRRGGAAVFATVRWGQASRPRRRGRKVKRFLLGAAASYHGVRRSRHMAISQNFAVLQWRMRKFDGGTNGPSRLAVEIKSPNW